jgi:hypothetical protein
VAYRLSTFDVDDVRVLADELRALSIDAASMEEGAQRVAQHLYATFVDDDGGPACALVRVYKTHTFAKLEPQLQDFARAALDDEPDPDVKCLTLFGTAGARPEWNSRHRSVGHKTIPLPSEQMVVQLPMVSQLITQLGLDIGVVVRPSRDVLVDLSQRTYGVFYVPDAAVSEHIPAQDFVAENGIESAVGFGGMLYTGDFYAVVLFARVHVSRQVAETLRILALPVRLALLPAAGRTVFAAAAARV